MYIETSIFLNKEFVEFIWTELVRSICCTCICSFTKAGISWVSVHVVNFCFMTEIRIFILTSTLKNQFSTHTIPTDLRAVFCILLLHTFLLLFNFRSSIIFYLIMIFMSISSNLNILLIIKDYFPWNQVAIFNDDTFAIFLILPLNASLNPM